MHEGFGPDVTLLLVSDWKDPRIRPVLRRIAGLAKLTTKGYLDSLSWLPDGLREVIAVHALDGGSGPKNTPALYAAMPAVIAEEGAWVPQGGLHELVLALARLAEAGGAELRTGEPVERVEPGRVFAGGIYTMNADGSKPKKTNRNSGVAFASPGWSPDGTRIVFTSDQEGGSDVYVMRANGAGQQRLTVNGLPRDASPVFSPDGRKIAFETNKEGNFEIYEMRTDGTNPVNLTDDPAADLTPDCSHWRSSIRAEDQPPERKRGRTRRPAPSDGKEIRDCTAGVST